MLGWGWCIVERAALLGASFLLLCFSGACLGSFFLASTEVEEATVPAPVSLNCLHDQPGARNALTNVLAIYALGLLLVTGNALLRWRDGAPLDWLFYRTGPFFCVVLLGVLSVFSTGRHPEVDAVPFLHGLAGIGMVGAAALVLLLPVAALLDAVGETGPPKEKGATSGSGLLGGLALALLLALIVFWARWHTTPDALAEALAEGQAKRVARTGGVVFGKTKDGVIHVAEHTAEAAGALQQRGLTVETARGAQVEFPLPPWYFLLVPVGIALLHLLRHLWLAWAGERAPFLPVVTATLFGGWNVFVLLWLLYHVLGGPSERPHPHLAGAGLAVLVFAGLFSAATLVLVALRGEPWVAMGWADLFFAIHLLAAVGLYGWCYKTPGNPALLWMLAHAAGGCLCGAALLLRGREAAG